MTRSHVTTHVLDAARGQPAAGIVVRLERQARVGWEAVASARSDEDGRCGSLGPEQLDAGAYRLCFDTGAWFADEQRETFYPEVTIAFRITDVDAHYHVPLLLSPFAYSTYRGS